jgi:hypothetical protein
VIETWALPGPSALVATVVADLVDGHQCLLYGSPPPGFRRAVEDAVTERQIRLFVVYDEPVLDPRTLLLREAPERPSTHAALPAGVWWVEGATPERADAWAAEATALAEVARGEPAWRRPLLAVLLPTDSILAKGLDVVGHRVEPLGRLDLEVAARYEAATGRQGPLLALRISLAVEMASFLLPGPAALDLLSHWMAAPDAVYFDVGCLKTHAAAAGMEIALPELLLWRAQHATLLVEIDRLRLEIIRIEGARWRVPYRHPLTEGRLAKEVRVPECLELAHLCAQLRADGVPLWSPLRRYLESLRDARNSLSHLQPLGQAELAALTAETGAWRQ